MNEQIKIENHKVQTIIIQENEAFQTQINHLAAENKKIISQLKLEEEKRMHELREKNLIEQAEMQSRFEQEKRNIAQQYEVNLQEKENQFNERQKKTMEMLDQLK